MPTLVLRTLDCPHAGHVGPASVRRPSRLRCDHKRGLTQSTLGVARALGLPVMGLAPSNNFEIVEHQRIDTNIGKANAAVTVQRNQGVGALLVD